MVDGLTGSFVDCGVFLNRTVVNVKSSLEWIFNWHVALSNNEAEFSAVWA